MKKKEKQKRKKLSFKSSNKGITLIALVITIIVLLILAGVTINLTLGENGIFKTAEMAGKNYTQAQEQELAGLANFENTINNIIGVTGNNGGSGTDTPEVTEPLLKDVAKPGDYVKYDTGIEGIGDNRDGIVTFRVLYNDSTYGLQIISNRNVEKVTLGTDGEDLASWQESMSDYNNAIEILNEVAYDYAENSPYAIDGRCVGSVPIVGADGTFNAKNTENLGPVELQFTTTVEGANNMKAADENYVTDYDTMEALEESGVPNILTKGENYWLASRNDPLSYSSSCAFRMRGVLEGGGLNASTWMCAVNSSSDRTLNYSHEQGLRPCISLKSDIKVIGGDGTYNTPYIFADPEDQ